MFVLGAAWLVSGCEGIEEICTEHNAVRQVSTAHVPLTTTDPRAMLACLSETPDLARVHLASSLAGLESQVSQIPGVQSLVESADAQMDDAILEFFQVADPASTDRYLHPNDAFLTCLAYVIRERGLRAAAPVLTAFLERHRLDQRALFTALPMVQDALWNLIGRPTLPEGGLAVAREFIIAQAKRMGR